MMTVKSILLPYNFTPLDRKALNFVTGCLSPEMNRITLYHGYPPLPDITPNDKSVMSSLKANLSYLNQQISNMENSLNDIREELVKCGFHESRVHVIFKARRKEIGAEIIELAHKNHYDLIVLNRISGRISRYFTNSVYQRVIASLKNTAVCVVS